MKKSYVFNTLICCGCTALIFLLHFIVYGGVLLKSSGYTGLFCAGWIAHAAGYSGTLEPETRPQSAVRVRLLQLLYCILFVSVLFAPSRTRITFCAGSAWYTAWFTSFSSCAKEITARNRGLRRS